MAQESQSAVNQFYSLVDTAWKFRSIPNPSDPESTAEDRGPRDMSEASIEVRADFWRQTLRELGTYNQEDFSDQDRMNYDIFLYIVEDYVATYDHKSWLLPFNAEGGFHTGFAFRANRPLRNERAVNSYVSSLKGFEMQVEQYIAIMRKGITEGFTMPCVIVEGFDQTAASYVAEPEESVFYNPVTMSKELLSSEEWNSADEQVRTAIENHLNPAYSQLSTFLKDEYIPACRQSIAATSLPGGEALYDQRIKHFTTLDMSARDVFETGEREVKRIRAEMQQIIDELEFEGTFEEFLAFLRTDEQFYATTPRQLLAEASYHAKRIDGKLPAYFGKLPRLSYGVDPVPDEIAPRYTGGRYVPGSADAGRSGTYWVNTYKLESRPLYVLPSLTLHEAVPGHHLQISLAAELDDLPQFRSNYYISAFGEGWALYTEYLGKEMGMYETPYEEFGALTYEMWRACRLVVDPGMHAFGWTRQEAVDFMSENTALSLHEINTEINRYIGWPGQAVSYKIGELKIRELRQLAEDELGDSFDIRKFHDAVLEHGSVPLFVLERHITDWIDAQESSDE